jgi:hypothetical protein
MEQDGDAMVIVAALVSRVEALVVASMLEAEGIFVHIGGAAHASVSLNSLALGGHRLWIPASQHRVASDLLLEVLGKEEWAFCPGLRRAVVKLMAVWLVPMAIIATMGIWFGEFPVAEILLFPLSAFSLPVNPQGRGDYYLADDDGGIVTV